MVQHLAQSTANVTGQGTEALCSLVLSISKDGDPTASLGNVVQHLTTEEFFFLYLTRMSLTATCICSLLSFAVQYLNLE